MPANQRAGAVDSLAQDILRIIGKGAKPARRGSCCRPPAKAGTLKIACAPSRAGAVIDRDRRINALILIEPVRHPDSGGQMPALQREALYFYSVYESPVRHLPNAQGKVEAITPQNNPQQDDVPQTLTHFRRR